MKTWSHPPGSNRRPADYESAALPTELGWPIVNDLAETSSPSMLAKSVNLDLMFPECSGTNACGPDEERTDKERSGAPGMTRTCDLLVRSQTLYPTELRART